MTFRDAFKDLKDHRMNRTKLHSLESILFISLAAVIGGAETWNEIEEFGNEKIDWFRKHLDLPNGIPSHDTFNRFFSTMDPSKFEECFRNWVKSIIGDLKNDVIAIDGKTVVGSRGYNRNPLHIVSAWSTSNGISLGQISTAEKSNEITAIPMLLESLMIEGSIITIDAMGTQTDIANMIISSGADYILAVKNNHKILCNNIKESFKIMPVKSVSIEEDFGHGRIEVRKCSIINDLELIDNVSSWIGIKSIVKIDSTRYDKTTQKTETSVRYYISSLNKNATEMAKAIRSHWGIESNLHWMLDVSFGEDNSQKRNKNAVLNFSLLNKIALKILKDDTTSKVGVKSRRLKAGWGTSYLEKVLGL